MSILEIVFLASFSHFLSFLTFFENFLGFFIFFTFLLRSIGAKLLGTHPGYQELRTTPQTHLGQCLTRCVAGIFDHTPSGVNMDIRLFDFEGATCSSVADTHHPGK